MEKTLTAPNASALRRMAKRVVEELLLRGQTLSTAESCTGGLIAKSMTDIPGSSAAFSGGCVTYTNEAKITLVGVAPKTIERDTEVSASCAEEMTRGVRERLGSTYALSTTGFAGPGGGTEKDPVGTVYIALATPDSVRCERLEAPCGSTRSGVRNAAAYRALEMLLEEWKRELPKTGKK